VVRRTERALIGEYRAAIEQALAALPEDPAPGGTASEAALELATELAGLPDMVRGYEEIKLASVARYRARQAEILASLARQSRTVRSA
jgi:indolepyruvate ferredoxin oxidoreductase